MDFVKTVKQKQAITMLSGSALHNMLFGGSRSGKTFIFLYCVFVRAIRCRSRHAVFRLNFNHIKTSIWLDTLPKVLKICFPHLPMSFNKTDYYVTLPNGSEVWFCGLDDDKRVEKVLGKEFSTLYFNECSQISYSSIQMAISRLAEKNDLKKKIYYDENPPSKTHWSYWVFMKYLNPQDDEPITDVENYVSMMINPKDNIENIDDDYLKILEKMPQKEKDRFLNGLFAESDDGVAYYAFSSDRHVKDDVELGDGQIYISMDFNVDPMTASIFQIVNNEMHVVDEIYLRNSDTFKMCAELKKRGYKGTVIPDSTGQNRKTSGKSDFKILKDNGFTIPKVRNPLQVDRVNNINRLFTEDRIYIHPRCKKLIADLTKVSWKDGKLDQKGTNKMLTHCSDNIGYGAWWWEPIMEQKKSKSY